MPARPIQIGLTLQIGKIARSTSNIWILTMASQRLSRLWPNNVLAKLYRLEHEFVGRLGYSGLHGEWRQMRKSTACGIDGFGIPITSHMVVRSNPDVRCHCF